MFIVLCCYDPHRCNDSMNTNYCRILWLEDGCLWQKRLRPVGIEQAMVFGILKTAASSCHRAHSSRRRDSLDHFWCRVPDTWRLNEPLLLGWLK